MIESCSVVSERLQVLVGVCQCSAEESSCPTAKHSDPFSPSAVFSIGWLWLILQHKRAHSLLLFRWCWALLVCFQHCWLAALPDLAVELELVTRVYSLRLLSRVSCCEWSTCVCSFFRGWSCPGSCRSLCALLSARNMLMLSRSFSPVVAAEISCFPSCAPSDAVVVLALETGSNVSSGQAVNWMEWKLEHRQPRCHRCARVRSREVAAVARPACFSPSV